MTNLRGAEQAALADQPKPKPEKDLASMLALSMAIKYGKWLHTMDAKAWAQRFYDMGWRVWKEPGGVEQDQIGLMAAWFANAIMAGYETAISRGASPQPAPEQTVVEPARAQGDFTGSATAALLWVLWHHQGASSSVGQPIRFALGMGQHERLSDRDIEDAKRWERETGAKMREQPARELSELSDKEILRLWDNQTITYVRAPTNVRKSMIVCFARAVLAAREGK